MPRRLTPSQLRSQIRKAQSDHKRAVDKYNAAVREYNRKARSHNQRVKAARSRVLSELRRLQHQPASTVYVSYRVSTTTLHRSYINLAQAHTAGFAAQHPDLLELAEHETANSLAVANALLGDAGDPYDEGDEEATEEDLRTSTIAAELSAIMPDLNLRWAGAVFALSPHNPDAARHFCTSAREIFTELLDHYAPDKAVLQAMPGCALTERGSPTRAVKIRYLLRERGILDEAFEAFVEQNSANIVELFKTMNGATHGPAGRFDLRQLFAIKTRVEDGILFLASVLRPR